MRWMDWLLVACAAALVVIGPVMAAQELGWVPGSRAAWWLPITVLVLATGALGSLAALRAVREPDVRELSTRLVVLLVGGLLFLDLTWLLDGLFFRTASRAARAWVVAWAYPAVGVLLAGSTWRLAQLHHHFARKGREPQFEL